MTENEFKFCCTVFCEYFEGRKYGEIFEKCYPEDVDLIVTANCEYSGTIADFIRFRMSGTYIMNLSKNKCSILGRTVTKVSFETTNNFLSYFKIPFEDIV